MSIAQPKIQWHAHSLSGGPRQPGGGEPIPAKIVEELERSDAFRIEVFLDRSDHAAVRVLRRGLQGHGGGVHGRAVLLGRQGTRARSGSSTIPFGMNPTAMAYWYRGGRRPQAVGGHLCAVQPGAASRFSNAPQMGGWFRRKINTLGDFKGLENAHGRVSAVKVIARAGGTADPHAGLGDLCRSRTRRDRRRRNGSGRTMTCSSACTRRRDIITIRAGTSRARTRSSASTARRTRHCR